MYKRQICNYTHGVSGSLTAQLGAGNILGTLQVHHITVILKVVKFAAPVRTKYQKIHLILDDIAELLPLVLLDDDLICKTGTAYILNPFQKAVPVSYTHLDVYKRQTFRGAVLMPAGFNESRGNGIDPDLFWFQFFYQGFGEEVEDVYKRQG